MDDLERAGYIPQTQFVDPKVKVLGDEEFMGDLGSAVVEALRILRGISMMGSKEENQLKAASKILDYALSVNHALGGGPDSNEPPKHTTFVFQNSGDLKNVLRAAASQATAEFEVIETEVPESTESTDA